MSQKFAEAKCNSSITLLKGFIRMRCRHFSSLSLVNGGYDLYAESGSPNIWLVCGVLHKGRGWKNIEKQYKVQVEWRKEEGRKWEKRKVDGEGDRKRQMKGRGRRLGYLQITSQCDRFLWRLNWARGLRGNQSKSWVTGKESAYQWLVGGNWTCPEWPHDKAAHLGVFLEWYTVW